MSENEINIQKAVFEKYLSHNFLTANSVPNEKNTRYIQDDIGKLLPENKNLRVLEIGVGMGHFAFFATQVKKYAHYFGIDISPECIEFVRDHVTKEVQYFEDPLSYLQSLSESYDLIVMFDVIEHIPKQQQPLYIKALYKALVPQGQLFLRTENTVILSGYYQHTMDYTHEYNFSQISLSQLLRLGGFNDFKLFGDRHKIVGVRSILRLIVLKLWTSLLKLIYEIERPGCINPSILSKNIYAVCKK